MVNDRPQLDLLPTADVIGLLLAAEDRVVPAVRDQLDALVAGAELIAQRLAAGGRLLFVGAGTSGRLALGEAAELPGTFGLDAEVVCSRMAGGASSTDCAEDDVTLAGQDLADLAIGRRDTVIAVAASGRTPYTLAMARTAREAGAAVVAVVTATGTPLAGLADVAVEIAVGPEVLNGSTRLCAGSAQKTAMDALTTAAMVRLGRVHGDLMIDVVAANAKLRARSAGIVADITGCSPEDAAHALAECGGNARAAVLRLELGLSAADAIAHAAGHRSLREALAALR